MKDAINKTKAPGENESAVQPAGCRFVYISPIGKMIGYASDKLEKLYFASGDEVLSGGGVFCQTNEYNYTAKLTVSWLDIYFLGRNPDFEVPVRLSGTAFQLEVWEMLRDIPYGQTVTYGEIAEKIAQKHGIKRMSAQAVGGAVGRNSVNIIVPCHRVVGKNGSLVGYAGGIERKRYLLLSEGAL